MIELSIVVPVYGCGDCLSALYTRLCASASQIAGDFELIFVDDRSPDGSWDVLCELARSDGRVRAFRLSRNFGQVAAITAGLSRSAGRWTVVIDCDLEEPPEAIPRLYEKAREGYDVVFGTRTSWKHPWVRRLGSRLYRSLMLESGNGAEYGTLSILSRKVVGAFLELRDKDREYVVALDWLGFRRAAVEFEHAQRPSGESSYGLRRLVSTAVAGMFFRTTVLLRWVVLLGFLIAVSGVGLAVYNIAAYFSHEQPSGYTSLVVLLLVLVGFVIVSLGVVGLYVGRIFEQVKGRPLFVIDEQAPPPGKDEAASGEQEAPEQTAYDEELSIGPERTGRE